MNAKTSKLIRKCVSRTVRNPRLWHSVRNRIKREWLQSTPAQRAQKRRVMQALMA